MKVVKPDGEESSLWKPRRLRDDELIIERDIRMYLLECRGRSRSDIARLFGVSRQLVNFRIKNVIPEHIKLAIERFSGLDSRGPISDDIPDHVLTAMVNSVREYRKGGPGPSS